MKKCANCEQEITGTYKVNAICLKCYESGEFIHALEVNRRNLNRYDHETYWEHGSWCLRKEDVDNFLALSETELDNFKLSERYGYRDDTYRRMLIELVCKKKKLDKARVLEDTAVDMFIDYGLVKDVESTRKWAAEKKLLRKVIKRYRKN